MIFFWIVGAIGLGAWATIVISEFRSRYGEPWLALTLGGLMAITLSFLASLLCQLVAAVFVGTHYAPEYHYDLLNIRDGSSVEGSFFLGSGYVDGKAVFQFYERQPDGSARLVQEDADDASVIESSGAPHVEYWYENSDHPLFLSNWLVHDHYVVKFYVPKGSIITNYKLGG